MRKCFKRDRPGHPLGIELNLARPNRPCHVCQLRRAFTQWKVKMRRESWRDIDKRFSHDAWHPFKFAGESQHFFVPSQPLEFMIALQQVQVRADELRMIAQTA